MYILSVAKCFSQELILEQGFFDNAPVRYFPNTYLKAVKATIRIRIQHLALSRGELALKIDAVKMFNDDKEPHFSTPSRHQQSLRTPELRFGHFTCYNGFSGMKDDSLSFLTHARSSPLLFTMQYRMFKGGRENQGTRGYVQIRHIILKIKRMQFVFFSGERCLGRRYFQQAQF